MPVIQQWGAKHGVDGVIWTDLRSNFEDETGSPFTVERAKDYLLGLPKSAADQGAPVTLTMHRQRLTHRCVAMQEARWL